MTGQFDTYRKNLSTSFMPFEFQLYYSAMGGLSVEDEMRSLSSCSDDLHDFDLEVLRERIRLMEKLERLKNDAKLLHAKIQDERVQLKKEKLSYIGLQENIKSLSHRRGVWRPGPSCRGSQSCESLDECPICTSSGRTRGRERRFESSKSDVDVEESDDHTDTVRVQRRMLEFTDDYSASETVLKSFSKPKFFQGIKMFNPLDDYCMSPKPRPMDGGDSF